MKYKSLLVRIPPDIHDALTRLRTQRHVNTIGEAGGGFRDLFEDMWRDLEDPQDSKKDAAGRKGTFRP